MSKQAAAGEIVVSEKAFTQAHMDVNKLESRSLQLKGISEPVPVRVMRA